MSFSRSVIVWQKRFGRHDLPWQENRDPYRIWVSEVMLQQTQVATVIPYFRTFIAEFPDLEKLANAPLDRVMQLWSGLGYYSRARNLHRCAQEVMNRYGGKFPREAVQLEALPGIGRSTAAAIAALAFGIPGAILDGNVKRVIARHFGIEGYAGDSKVQSKLWAVAQREVPVTGIQAYTQGLMDIGATVCLRSKPNCPVCPVSRSCVALGGGRISELPAAKPRAAVPQRFVLMLLIARGPEILLLKRPPAGIWGGLWSLPELPLEQAEFDAQNCGPQTLAQVSSWVAGQGLAIESQTLLAGFEHRFTHFRLGILPLQISASSASGLSRRVAEPASLWLPAQEVSGAALPKPVKDLLLRQFAGR